MAKKLKCDEDEIATPIKLAKNALEMIPDFRKYNKFIRRDLKSL